MHVTHIFSIKPLCHHFQELEHVKQTMAALDLRHQKLSLAYADTKQLVKQGDYKIENYDRVKVYDFFIET